MSLHIPSSDVKIRLWFGNVDGRGLILAHCEREEIDLLAGFGRVFAGW
jgi:hypothetical protein